ncbi:hypothetical protein AAFF_G00393970 [Aldrovandia affinis]|uniref:Uncharacterized protein n=1 Tax=Aldrovandia affinis TaxID=143900 RepID=A0AAD7SDR9_9TELE|nr:hypothetical protein AAFF_G00393970 [Aldrovandia affinis]
MSIGPLQSGTRRWLIDRWGQIYERARYELTGSSGLKIPAEVIRKQNQASGGRRGGSKYLSLDTSQKPQSVGVRDPLQ